MVSDVGRSSRSVRTVRKSRPEFVALKDHRGVLGSGEKDESKQLDIAPLNSSGSGSLVEDIHLNPCVTAATFHQTWILRPARDRA